MHKSMKSYIAIIATLFCTCTLYSANFSVINSLDSGPGSLRDAILQAAQNPGPDIIDIDLASGTIIEITSQDNSFNIFPSINDVTINGNGVVLQSLLTVGRFFQIGGASTINDLIFDNGISTGTSGAVFALGNTTFNRCLFVNNQASSGGAIRAFSGIITLNNCTLRNNTASTGAAILINSAATLNLNQSTLSDNTVIPGSGAATISVFGTLNMTNTIVANSLPAGALDIFDSGNTIVINSSNLVENFQCGGPGCASIVFDSAFDPELIPTDDGPYFLYAIDPNSPAGLLGAGALFGPGGEALLLPEMAATIPTLGEWAIINLTLLLMIIGTVVIQSKTKVSIFTISESSLYS